MKKILLFSITFFAVMLFAFKQSSHELTGKWYSKSPDSGIAFFDFNNNGNFKVTVNKQTENEGTYKLNNDTFYMFDKNCGMDVAGKYLLHFYGYDSVSFSIINDACTSRANEVNGGVIKKVRD